MREGKVAGSPLEPISCPGQVGCYTNAVFFLGSHAGVVENVFALCLIPHLLYLFRKTPLWKSYHLLSSLIPRLVQIREIPELWNSMRISGTKAQKRCSAGRFLPGNKMKFLFPSESQGESAFTYSPASSLSFSSASRWTAITSTPGIAIDSDDCPGM